MYYNNRFGGMSNFAPIGQTNNTGMMGGYYNQYGGGYANPYLLQKQREAEAIKQREEARRNADMMKKIARKVHYASNSNIDDIEEHVKKYDPVDHNDSRTAHETHYVQLVVSLQSSQNAPAYNTRPIEEVNSRIEKTKEEFPDDMSVFDYFEKAGSIIVQNKLDEQRDSQRDLSKLYDTNKYKELVKMHSKKKGIFSSLFDSNRSNMDDLDIDDMEIHLPSESQNQYAKKREEFFRSISGGV